MRYILGLCVVLAVGNPAWTSEMSSVAGEPEYQTPAATVTSAVTQATGTPALPRRLPPVLTKPRRRNRPRPPCRPRRP